MEDLLPSDDESGIPPFEEWFPPPKKDFRVCSRSICPNPAEDGRQACARCRAAQERYRATGKQKVKMKRHSKTEKYKAARQRYRQSDKGKAATARRTAMYSVKLAVSLQKMLTGAHACPVTFPQLGVFKTNAEVAAHFESTFEPWMSHENYGAYHSGDDYNVKWNIGHRIPKAAYDHSNPEDVKRCWSRANLFAQCARENAESQDKAPIEVNQLKSVWPTGWA